MSTSVVRPTAQAAVVRPQTPEQPAKPVARPSRRSLLNCGLIGSRSQIHLDCLDIYSRQESRQHLPYTTLPQNLINDTHVGFSGLGGSRAASADETSQSTQAQTEHERYVPNMDRLQANQVCTVPTISFLCHPKLYASFSICGCRLA